MAEQKTDQKSKKKKDIPLIVAGAIIAIGAYLVAIPLVHTDFAAVANIVMFAGVIVVLIGFRVPWTRKKKK